MTRACERCGEEFESKRERQRFCCRMEEAACLICDAKFTRQCGHKLKETCSLSCGRTLVRRRAAEKEGSRKCRFCGDSFVAASQGAIYCRKPLVLNCRLCHGEFEAVCMPVGHERVLPRWCSSSCRNGDMRANNYRIKSLRQCGICGVEFQPTNSRQLSCGVDERHMRFCLFCGDTFRPNSLRASYGKALYCDSVCSTLGQMNSKMPRELVYDYKHLDEWVARFEASNGRKPWLQEVADFLGALPKWDVLSEAGVKLPRSGSSYLEERVVHFLGANFPSLRFERNHRTHGRADLEVDILLPELGLGLEVQDFTTHSRQDTEGFNPWGDPMKGPSYHEHKRAVYRERGVTVVDLWEDEIRSGAFEEHVRVLVQERLSSGEMQP